MQQWTENATGHCAQGWSMLGNRSIARWGFPAIAILLLILASAGLVEAQDAENANESAAREGSRTGPRSLAGIAGGITLQRSDQGTVVISNHNLAALAARGRISEGSDLAGPDTAAEADEELGPARNPSPAEQIESRIEAQQNR